MSEAGQAFAPRFPSSGPPVAEFLPKEIETIDAGEDIVRAVRE